MPGSAGRDREGGDRGCLDAHVWVELPAGEGDVVGASGEWVGRDQRAGEAVGCAGVRVIRRLAGRREVRTRRSVNPDVAPSRRPVWAAVPGVLSACRDDQDSGRDDEFDDLFRTHLKNVYRGLGVEPPRELDLHIVPHVATWTFVEPIKSILQGDRLRILTNCPGLLHWQLDGAELRSAPLVPVGGVMAGAHRHHITLGPFHGSRVVRFRFQCTHPGCDCKDVCCNPEAYEVEILPGPVHSDEGG